MYEALQHRMPLDEALDLIEIDDVGKSWRAAEMYNGEKISDLIAQRNGDGA